MLLGPPGRHQKKRKIGKRKKWKKLISLISDVEAVKCLFEVCGGGADLSANQKSGNNEKARWILLGLTLAMNGVYTKGKKEQLTRMLGCFDTI